MMPEELVDFERKVAPAPLRARAGFAKTHARPTMTWWEEIEDSDQEPPAADRPALADEINDDSTA
jgi:hypothetical protein